MTRTKRVWHKRMRERSEMKGGKKESGKVRIKFGFPTSDTQKVTFGYFLLFERSLDVKLKLSFELSIFTR